MLVAVGASGLGWNGLAAGLLSRLASCGSGQSQQDCAPRCALSVRETPQSHSNRWFLC
jgi:hypothetical protein